MLDELNGLGPLSVFPPVLCLRPRSTIVPCSFVRHSSRHMNTWDRLVADVSTTGVHLPTEDSTEAREYLSKAQVTDRPFGG